MLNALRRDGLRLINAYFRPDPDTEQLINGSVTSNTFRGFPAQRPAEVYRSWARDRMTFGAIAELGEITIQDQMNELVNRRFEDLEAYWFYQSGIKLVYGPGRKLVNLLHKSIVRDSGLSDAGRKRVIPLVHVPHDKFCLAAVRLSAASGLFGSPMDIPRGATIGYINSNEQYATFQTMLGCIARVADVPPIAIDLLAWDQAHGL